MTKLIHLKTFVLSAFLCISCFAQTETLLPFKSPADLIHEGIDLYNKEQYKEALEKFRSIDYRDENYQWAQYELALTHHTLKENQEAITLLKRAITTFGDDYKPNYTLLGAVMDDVFGLDSAVYYYNLAQSKFPFESKFEYEKAISYYKNNDTINAISSLQKSIELNYFKAEAHHFLGLVCLEQNQLSRGLLSLLTYMTLEPENRNIANTLVYAEPFVAAKAVVHPDSIMKYDWGGVFKKSDQLIKNKIALSADFKTSAALDYKILRQIEVMLSQLKSIEESEDFWVQKYVPIFREVFSNNSFSSLCDYWFQNVVEVAGKRYKANKTQTDLYIQDLSAKMRSVHTRKVLPGYLDHPEVYVTWNDEGIIDAIYEKYDQNQFGKAVTINEAGKINGRGELDKNGDLVGELIKTTDDSTKIIYHEEDGITFFQKYYSNGNLSESGSTKEGKNIGKYESFYFDGKPKKKATFDADGYYNDIIEEFYANGQLKSKCNYVHGKAEGLYLSFFANGQKEFEYHYKDNKETGLYTAFFDNGKVVATGNLQSGLLEGTWNYYYRNGQLLSSINFSKNERQGFTTDYYISGEKQLEHTYRNGKLDGRETYFDKQGVAYVEYVYKKGELVEINGLKAINQHIHTKVKSGEITFWEFYPSGRTKFTVLMKNGLFEGKGEYYFSSGSLSFINHYKNGLKNGIIENYYNNGKLKNTYLMKNDTLSGQILAYHKNGQLAYSGNYYKGEHAGEWNNYYLDGRLKSNYYNLDGKLHGDYIEYYRDGKPLKITKYEEGKIIGFKQFGLDEKLLIDSDFASGYGTFIEKHPNGKEYYQVNLVDGKYEGELVGKHSNGQLAFIQYHVNGKLNGEYKEYNILGNVKNVYTMVNGVSEGLMETFEFDQIQGSISFLVDGDYEGERKAFSGGSELYTTTYSDDEIDGEYILYDFDGKTPAAKLYYENNFIYAYSSPLSDGSFSEPTDITQSENMVTINYPNGQKAFEGMIKKGLLDGTIKLYGLNGNLRRSRQMVMGDDEGVYEEYYPNGLLRIKKFYVNDELDGQVLHYDINGKEIHSLHYKMGEKEGLEVFFDAAGKVISQQNWIIDYEN